MFLAHRKAVAILLQNCLAVCYLWLAPLESVAILLLLCFYVQLGAVTLSALVLLALIVPLQYLFNRFVDTLRLVRCYSAASSAVSTHFCFRVAHPHACIILALDGRLDL